MLRQSEWASSSLRVAALIKGEQPPTFPQWQQTIPWTASSDHSAELFASCHSRLHRRLAAVCAMVLSTPLPVSHNFPPRRLQHKVLSHPKICHSILDIRGYFCLLLSPFILTYCNAMICHRWPSFCVCLHGSSFTCTYVAVVIRSSALQHV